MTIDYNDGSTRRIAQVHYRDDSATRALREVWYHDGTATRRVFLAFSVSVTALSSDTSGNLAARVYFDTNGQRYRNDGAGSQRVSYGSWGTPNTTGEGANWYIRFTHASGNNVTVEGSTLASGESSPWYRLDQERDVLLSAGPLNSERNAAVNYTISPSSDGSNPVGTASISLTNVNGAPP